MKKLFGRPTRTGSVMLGVMAVGLLCGSVSRAQTATVPFPQSKWNRVLIVSGGPSPQFNQYAIESNARYVASLTKNAQWRRILFADGNPTSKTIPTLADNQNTRAATLASRLLGIPSSGATPTYEAPTLSPINGPSTPASITQNLNDFAAQNTPGPQLVYVTGHGSPGAGPNRQADYLRNVYNSWGANYSVSELSRALQATKSPDPIVLIMVQCYSGAFANVMFQEGDPTKPVWDHDFCGFFAAIPQRMAAGCTPEVNERNYQDFTTYFFAALSGVSRDGQRVTGADYDGNGKVSFDEAYGYAQINDDSIDVPVSTSDAYLRVLYPAAPNTDWLKTPYATLLQNATPSQKAVLTQLSEKLGLAGEDRLNTVQTRLTEIQTRLANQNRPQRRANQQTPTAPGNQPNAATPAAQPQVQLKLPEGVTPAQFNTSFTRLQKLLTDRFPNIKTASEAEKKQALTDATALLLTDATDLDLIYNTIALNSRLATGPTVEEARLLRFLREGRSIILAMQVQQTGTPDQKAMLARLHTSETRSIF